MKKIVYVLLLGLFACTSKLYVPNINFTDSYEEYPSNFFQGIKYSVLSNGQLEFTLTFLRSQMLPKKENNTFYIQFALKIKLFKSLQKNLLLDTFGKVYQIDLNSVGTTFDISLHTQQLKAFPSFALIEVEDLHRKSKTFTLVEMDSLLPIVDKTSFSQHGNIHLVRMGDTITFEMPTSAKDVKLSYYAFKDYFPAPPYVEFSEKPHVDSIVSIPLVKLDSTHYFFVAEKQGLYKLIDVASKQQYYWYAVSASFPLVQTYEEMLFPLRYLTSESEYNKIKQNPQTEIESFWLRIGGSEELARELIRRYYHRVRRANELFTKHVEGWRTDRGMIYMVMGKPTSVYRNDQHELWIYGQENNMMSMQFQFAKQEVLPGLYDFVMVRNTRYKDFWFNMIEIWRK